MSNKQMTLLRVPASKKKKLVNNGKKMKTSGAKNFLIKLKDEPVSYSYKNKSSTPKFKNKKSGQNVCVSHHEYICDITSNSIGYNVASVPINPGMNQSFPWLSKIAKNWEAFRIKKVVFIFKPATSTNTPGTLMMASDPNPLHASPETKTDFLSLKNAVCSSVFKSLAFSPLTSDVNLEKSYYIRSQAPGSNQDLRLFDPCNFYIAYWGVPSSTVIGEIHIMYDIEFLNPQLDQSLQQISNVESWNLIPTATGSSTPYYPLGTTMGSAINGLFSSVGMKYLPGTASGHNFSVTKTINKLFTTVMNLGSSWVSGGIPGLAFKVLQSALGTSGTNLDSSNEVLFIDSDTDVLAAYVAGTGTFSDISSSVISYDYNGTLTSSPVGRVVVQGGNGILQNVALVLKPGQVLNITWDTAGSIIYPSSSGVYSFKCTDRLLGY